MPAELKLKTEDFDTSGATRASLDGKEYLVWNALPGETVSAHKVAKKNGRTIAFADKIIEKSKNRQKPKEVHYLSCSPWQSLKYKAENEYKLEIAKKLFKDRKISSNGLKIVSPQKQYGYRNKMEFSIYAETDNYKLAFFKRAQRGKQVISECKLALPSINSSAQEILDYINSQPFAGRVYKSLLIRSNQKQEALAALFVTVPFEFSKFKFRKGSKLKGLKIFLSDPKSPASIVTEEIASYGDKYINEELNGFSLRIDALSFFQINPPAFQETLADLKPLLVKGDYLDFYGGTGGLSIPLSKKIDSCIIVDSSKENIENANYNIKSNRLTKFRAEQAMSEEMLQLVNSNTNLLLDPPRSGLHADIVKRIVSVRPPHIYYLSCNIETQLRDVSMLLNEYTIIFKRIYNYFPRTPHFESLLVLRRNQ